MIANFIWRLYEGSISELLLFCISLTQQSSCKFSALVVFAAAFRCHRDTKQQKRPGESGLYLISLRLDLYLYVSLLRTLEIQFTDITRRTGQTDQQADWLALLRSDTDAVQSLQNRHSSRISQGFIQCIYSTVERYDFSLPC